MVLLLYWGGKFPVPMTVKTESIFEYNVRRRYGTKYSTTFTPNSLTNG